MRQYATASEMIGLTVALVVTSIAGAHAFLIPNLWQNTFVVDGRLLPVFLHGLVVLSAILIAHSYIRRAQMARMQNRLDEIEGELAAGRMESRIDALTGLGNRRMWDETLRREIDLANRSSRAFAIGLVDIDDMKMINSNGHDAGDRAIKRVADFLSNTMRSSDVVTRWGGDEFGVIAIIPDRDGSFEAMCYRVENELGELSVSVPVTIGWCLWSAGKTITTMESEASKELLRKKVLKKSSVD